MKNTSNIKNFFLKQTVLIFQKTAYLSALSCRLVQWTGKHPDPIHPKHLLQIRTPWYFPYVTKSDLVLDIGCNNGQHSLKIAPKCKRIVGFDIDKTLLGLAQKEAKRKGIKNCSFVYGDAQKEFPFKRESFDLIVFLDVFEHLVKRKEALLEVRRVLKKDGYLLLSIPNSETSWKKLQKSLGLFYYSDPDHKVEFSQTKITTLLKSAGFTTGKLFPVTFDTPWVGFIDLLGGISFSLYKKACQWRRNKTLHNPSESIGFEIVATKNNV